MAARPRRPCSPTSSARSCSRSRRTSTEVPERLIISGVELHEVDEVVGAFGALREVERRDDAQWAAVNLVRR